MNNNLKQIDWFEVQQNLIKGLSVNEIAEYYNITRQCLLTKCRDDNGLTLRELKYMDYRVDFDELIELFKAGSSIKSVCSYFKITKGILNNRIEEKYGVSLEDLRNEYVSVGDENIRKTLYQLAVNGKDVKVLMFLAKNRIGYSDNPVNEKEDVNSNIKVNFNFKDSKKDV